ncbi:hypothetical protein [Saccharothrix sp.]|nr:hypothetical protein [Saccharothrix sp.]
MQQPGEGDLARGGVEILAGDESRGARTVFDGAASGVAGEAA